MGITLDKREVSTVPTVGGRESSGVVRGAKEVEDKNLEEDDEEEIVDPEKKLEEGRLLPYLCRGSCGANTYKQNT